MDEREKDTEDDFHVIYCCKFCHKQFESKTGIIQHRRTCTQREHCSTVGNSTITTNRIPKQTCMTGADAVAATKYLFSKQALSKSRAGNSIPFVRSTEPPDSLPLSKRCIHTIQDLHLNNASLATIHHCSEARPTRQINNRLKSKVASLHNSSNINLGSFGPVRISSLVADSTDDCSLPKQRCLKMVSTNHETNPVSSIPISSKLADRSLAYNLTQNLKTKKSSVHMRNLCRAKKLMADLHKKEQGINRKQGKLSKPSLNIPSADKQKTHIESLMKDKNLIAALKLKEKFLELREKVTCAKDEEKLKFVEQTEREIIATREKMKCGNADKVLFIAINDEKYTIVRLEDHTDKFQLEAATSFSQTDCAKSEEKSYMRYACTVCSSYKTPSRDAMEKHLTLHIIKKLTCHLCSFIGNSLTSMQEHNKKEHIGACFPLICELCGLDFHEIRTLNEHMGLVHDVPKLNCKVCWCTFKTDQALKEHILDDHPDQALKEHILDDHPDQALKEHILDDHPDQALKEHILDDHPDQALKEHILDDHPDQALKEHILDDHPDQALKEYILDDHPDQALKCDNCSKMFLEEIDYDKHLREKDCFEGANVCNYFDCRKTSHSSLSRHIRRVHLKEHRFSCKYCSYTSSQQYMMRNHVNTHLVIHPYHCELCSFSAVKQSQLVSHMRTHLGEKRFKCDKCPYCATWRVQLKQHHEVHYMPNSVSCSICQIFFRDDHALSLHNSKEHNATKEVRTAKEVHENQSWTIWLDDGSKVQVDTVDDYTSEIKEEPSYIDGLVNNAKYL